MQCASYTDYRPIFRKIVLWQAQHHFYAVDTSNIVPATVFCLRQLPSTLTEQSNSACDDRFRARHFALKKASSVVPKDTFLSPACLIVLMVDASVTWTAEFQFVFGCRSHSVGKHDSYWRFLFGQSWLLLTLKFFLSSRTNGDDTVLLFTFECEQDDLFLYSIFNLAHRTCMPGCEYCSVRFYTRGR